MELKGISTELKEKIDSCNSPEEVIELAKTEGYELTDEELEAVSGGGWGGEKKYRVECQT